jgi:hypothetical protein
VRAPSSTFGLLGRLGPHKRDVIHHLHYEPVFSKIRGTVDLEFFYVIFFEPTTTCTIVTGLSSSLGMFVFVRVVLRSWIVFF